jgi:uncharacterized protein YacL
MPSSIEIIYDISYKKLHSQMERSSATDVKTSIVLAVYGVLISSLCSNLPARFENNILLLLYFISFSSLIIGIWQAILSLTTRSYRVPPNLINLKNKYIEKENEETKKKIITSYVKAYEYNRIILSNKIKLLNQSLKYCLPLSVIFTILTLLSKSFRG